MKICAVVCELNPFHNGHEYLLREARRISGADFIIAVMSGDFVQRGVPAICDKYARTKQALMGGADLVVELPVMYATASADYFAQGAISVITSLGCVDSICFGSECGDFDLLRSCAGLCEENDPGLHILSQGAEAESTRKFKITKLLKEGVSFAKAYAEVTGNEFASNDMLAVRYLKSLDFQGYDVKGVNCPGRSGLRMTCICVKRQGGGYNDTGDSSFSARAVRSRISRAENIAHLVPKYVYRNLQSLADNAFPIYPDDLSIQMYTVLSGVLENEKTGDELLTDYMDVSDNVAGRIRSRVGMYKSLEQFVSAVHSKEYIKGRIYRALLHVMLGIRKTDYAENLEDCAVSYIRILGFRQSASALLTQIKETCIVPVISKAADANRFLDDEAMYLFDKDVRAANMYDMAAVFKFKKDPVHDYAREMVII